MIVSLGPEPIYEYVDSLYSDCLTNIDSLGANYITHEEGFLCIDSMFIVHVADTMNECFPLLGAGPMIDEKGYAAGFGRVKTLFYSPESSTEGYGGSNDLIYWKKGNEECGDFQEVLGLREVSKEIEIQVYPNPCTKIVNVDFTGRSELILMDSRGTVDMRMSHNNTSLIDVTKFPKGVFILKLRSESGILTRKVVVN